MRVRAAHQGKKILQPVVIRHAILNVVKLSGLQDFMCREGIRFSVEESWRQPASASLKVR
jgi:hypothetical protein